MKKIWDTIKGAVFGDGVLTQLNDIADEWFQSKEEKQAFMLQMKEFEHQRELKLQEVALKADEEFNQRIKDLEGTSKDLLAAGLMGKVILFFRGAQRPIWGYGVLYFDLQYFRGAIELGTQGEALLYAINLLVLGFLFGERAVKNVAPIIEKVLVNRAEAKK